MVERAHTKGRDRPILFSAPMVRALLAGTKTQTRRILGQFDVFRRDDGTEAPVSRLQIEGESLPRVTIGNVVTLNRLKAAVGDQLRVREAWRPNWSAEGYREDLGRIARPADFDPNRTAIEYLADDTHELNGKNRPGIHMPRWASRLTLTVIDVRVQRLRDISEEDAAAEGVECWSEPGMVSWRVEDEVSFVSAVGAYQLLWKRINGAGSWETNPWVAAYTFTVERRNIDAPTKGEATDVG